MKLRVSFRGLREAAERGDSKMLLEGDSGTVGIVADFRGCRTSKSGLLRAG